MADAMWIGEDPSLPEEDPSLPEEDPFFESDPSESPASLEEDEAIPVPPGLLEPTHEIDKEEPSGMTGAPSLAEEEGEGLVVGISWARVSRAYPLMSADEERATARASRTSQAAFHRMVGANIRLVIRVAVKIDKKRPCGMSRDDLIGEGVLGLIRAVQKFDPDRGFRFSTYAMHWIRQSIDRAIMNQSRTVRLPIHVQKALWQARKEAQAESGEEAPIRLSLENERYSLGFNASLQEEFYRDSENTTTYQDLLVDTRATPEETLYHQESKERIDALLNILTPRERDVMIHRFYGDQTRTLQKLGDDWGVSRERIRQIEREALKKLKASPEAQALRLLLRGGYAI